MKIKNLKFILGTFGLSLFALLIICFCVLIRFEYHEVDILNKSPVLPYANYEYMVTEDTVYEIDDKKQVVPAFFRTDFASIPQALWFWSAPYKSDLVYASIWHDYMYSCPNGMSRKEIDDIFLSLLTHEKASTFNSIQMYLAVRIFGDSHFYSDGICDELIVKEMAEDEDYFDEVDND